MILSLSTGLLGCLLVYPAAAQLTVQQMLQTISQFSADFTYPTVNSIAAEANYSGFTPDIVGRVDVTNAYLGNELNTEYIFKLFSSLGLQNTTRLIGIPGNNTLTEMAINPPVASFSVIRDFDWGPIAIPVQIDVWFLFDNSSGLISQYDITFRRMTWAFDYVLPYLRPALAAEPDLADIDPNNVDALVHMRAAIDICNGHQQYCVGDLQQYNSTKDCVDYIYRQTPLGKVYQWGGDTAMCRYVHKGMLQYRPSVHCAHIGPSGGDMCIKRNYVNEVLNPLYPQPFIPPGFA